MSARSARYADPSEEDSDHRGCFAGRAYGCAGRRAQSRSYFAGRAFGAAETKEGAGIVDDAAKLAKRTYDAVFHGGRSGAPPDVRRFVERHGSDTITGIVVCRKPIQSALKSVLNALSLGSINKALQEKGYDDIFHLYVYLDITAPSGERSRWRFEKNQVLTIKRSNSDRGEECSDVQLVGKPLTAGQLWENAVEFRGKRLFEYSADRDNCQAFVRDLLLANGLLKRDLNDFIMQDAQKLVPTYLRNPAKALTDLAARADVALHGRGILREHKMRARR